MRILGTAAAFAALALAACATADGRLTVGEYAARCAEQSGRLAFGPGYEGTNREAAELVAEVLEDARGAEPPGELAEYHAVVLKSLNAMRSVAAALPPGERFSAFSLLVLAPLGTEAEEIEGRLSAGTRDRLVAAGCIDEPEDPA